MVRENQTGGGSRPVPPTTVWSNRTFASVTAENSGTQNRIPHIWTHHRSTPPGIPWDSSHGIYDRGEDNGWAVDGWAVEDVRSLDIVVPTPAPSAPYVREPAPRLTNIGRVAEDASVLLELFSRTIPENDRKIDDEHKQMINDAFNHILKIKKEFRMMTTEGIEPESDDMKVDAGCIICYSYIADTVLMPCKHLALCTV